MRYFEYENDKFEYLSEYKSADPQRGIGFMPKRGVNMHDNEVVRMFKTVNDTYIEPISFIVPRRAEVFQDDIYPPTTGMRPAMSSGEWFDGKEGLPPKIDMASLYEGEGLKELPADAQPAATSAPKPAPVKEEPKKEEPKPTPAPSSFVNAPRDSIKDQAKSMANMVDKFADKEEKEEEDTSSFEEIPKPAERVPTISFSPAEETEAPKLWQAKEEAKPVRPSVAEVSVRNPSLSSRIPNHSQPITKPSSTPPTRTPGTATPPQGEIPSVILSELDQIKALIAEQTRTVAQQNEQIASLKLEIDDLKAKLS